MILRHHEILPGYTRKQFFYITGTVNKTYFNTGLKMWAKRQKSTARSALSRIWKVS